MTHAHDLLFLCESVFHKIGGQVGRADFFRHFECCLVCAAVQNAEQCADRCGYGRLDRCQRACTYAARKCAGIETVLHLQDLRGVENFYLILRWCLAVEHRQKVFMEGQVWVRWKRSVTELQLTPGGNEGGYACCDQ